MASSSTQNTFNSWPADVQNQLVDSIGDYLRQEDTDYDVNGFMDYFKPHLESGASREKIEETLLGEAQWAQEQTSPFVSFLWERMSELAPATAAKVTTEEKNSKKRERTAAENEESVAKRSKLVEAHDGDVAASFSLQPEESNSNHADGEDSKPLTAAERLAKIKANRANKPASGGLNREPGVDKFDAKRDRKLSSVSTYTPSDEEAEEAVPLRGRAKRDSKREVATSKKAGRQQQQRRRDESGDEDDGAYERPARRQESGKTKDVDRCVYYPNCTKGEDCPFFHPTEECTRFPNCAKGDNCDFVHPPCKFGENCQRRPLCPFAHSIASAGRAMMGGFGMGMGMGMPMGMGMGMPMGMAMGPPCKNGFACPKKPNCSFAHPAIACRFGKTCRNGMMCSFSHSAPCRNGAECTMAGCKFAHPAPPPKVDPNTVATLSDTLPLTPTKDGELPVPQAQADTPAAATETEA
jgi:hypothetical protein